MLQTLKLLLPALIPSWRFFDVIAPAPRIEVAALINPHDLPIWQEFRPRPQHVSIALMFKRMVWNPNWNETLFLMSCAERVVQNEDSHAAQEILARIKTEIQSPYLQFRLVFQGRQGDQLQTDIAYISPVYPA